MLDTWPRMQDNYYRMIERIKETLDLFKNMGWRYTQFRIRYELLRRTGLLRRKFPVKPKHQQYIKLEDWKLTSGNFFFKGKDSLTFPKNPSSTIEEKFNKIREGKFLFFNSIEFSIGKEYDWIINPDSSFKYDIKKHWTEIADYSKKAGDIKYVWEKSRFSYLYDVIRYDYHFDQDCSIWIFNEIISWIDQNPINCGPNYRCSQEISLRVLNWTFALHYYRNSEALTKEVFNKIQFAIYWQMRHVYSNINFSRIAVRNNHAITETLALFLVGLLYPQYPDSSKWKRNGKKWFEEEIAYQVYEDGTFLQFSMNYHRVVVQLLTWAITLAEKNSDTFKSVVYDRAKKSVTFLRTCLIDENGKLPNYGANDGALFFKLNNSDYRDYRPSLNALANVLKIDLDFPESEDQLWYGLDSKPTNKWIPHLGIHSFEIGGYYVFREEDSITFIRCGNHRDRPSQADNLHLDVWYKGQNVLADGGSYKYNTDMNTLKYFMGTASHNTVMIDDFDQMKKGGRFIWYYWSQCKNAACLENEGNYTFEGTIKAFMHLGKNIIHHRKVIKKKGKPIWIIEDSIHSKPENTFMKQRWHLPIHHVAVNWESCDSSGKNLHPLFEMGLISNLYGKKESSEEIIFTTKSSKMKTSFSVKV